MSIKVNLTRLTSNHSFLFYLWGPLAKRQTIWLLRS